MESLLQQLKGINTESPEKSFPDIAKNLMCNYIIKKGKKRYAIVEIEFYFYSKEHPDYITYPRKMDAGRWFFHQSGVDISFESDIELITKNDKIIYKVNDNSIFGGILIRGIYDIKNKTYIFGPQNCVNELWDNFDAFNYTSQEYPVLALASKDEKKFQTPNPIPYKRHIKLGKDKTIEIKEKEWAKRIGVTLSEKEDPQKVDSLEAKYRFFNIIDDENTWNAIKHLTNKEKVDLKKLIQG